MAFQLEDIYSESEGLIGSQCEQCGEQFFPAAASCARCSSEQMKRAALGHRGTLWSWTIQHFMPKPPFRSAQPREHFAAYGVGLVQVESGLVVKSRLRLGDEPLQIGQTLQLAITPFDDGAGGPEAIYEFRPGVDHE